MFMRKVGIMSADMTIWTIALAGLVGLTSRVMAQPADEWEKLLPPLRISRSDLSVRPARWETPLTLPIVENILEDPLSGPAAFESWDAALSSASRSADLIEFSGKLLDGGRRAQDFPLAGGFTGLTVADPCPGLPSDLIPVIAPLIDELQRAQILIRRASLSMSEQDRQEALILIGGLLRHEEFRRLESETFSKAARFDLPGMVEGARLAARAVDKALPALAAAKGRRLSRVRCSFPFGDALISGSGDDVYTGRDLENIALLIDLGGKNHYEAPVAAAGTGQLRVAVDFGHDLVFESTAASLGSGIFGVGLLYLPDSKSSKTLTAGDFSLGAGLFGVGGLFARGAAIGVEGGHFTQGAGAFGVGIFQADNPGGKYRARYAGQGFGFTRGAGLFLHHGAEASVEGGLYYRDSREPLGLLSLCQGVGYGPRAFAAGGVGIARLEGGRLTLNASYFAHGSGYWHGLGLLFLNGDDNQLQSRRYGQGSGIHAGAGAFILNGSRNRTITWGVGPAFGWDYGIGFLDARGNDNVFHSQWANGSGQFNGHGLAAISGDRNRLTLAGSGAGSVFRGAAGYGLVSVVGQANRMRYPGLAKEISGAFDARSNPWGILRARGELWLDPKLEGPKAQWPAAGHSDAAVADSFQGEAIRLMGRPDEEAAGIVDKLNPAAFDEFLWVRLVASALGDNGSRAAAGAFVHSSGLRKALALGLLRYFRISNAVEPAVEALHDSDWRLRREGAAVLGFLLDSSPGQEPGRLWIMRQARDYLASAAVAVSTTGATDFDNRLGSKRLTDLYGLLALDRDFSAAQRLELLRQAPSPFDLMSGDSFKVFTGMLIQKAPLYSGLFQRELKESEKEKNRARRALLDALNAEKDPDVLAALMGSLGLIGESADAPAVARGLEHAASLVREAAACALGKMGDQGRRELTGRLDWTKSRNNPLARQIAIVGLAQTPNSEYLRDLRSSFRDPDAEVRLTAIAALFAFQSPNTPRQKDFLDELRRLEQNDLSASVRASAAVAAAVIAPQ